MEKRLVSLFLILVFLIGNVSAAIPPTKQSLTIYNYKINEVICSGNSLEVLVESLASVNLKLLFKATNKTTESIFSNQELKSFETSWYSIKTTRPCGEFQKLEVNGYSISEDNKNIIYLNSESPYFFKGTESSINQPITTETLPSIQTTTSSTSNIYFGSKLIETINSNDGIKYYHQDHLGSTRLITDPSGNLVSRTDYDPFGRDLSFSNAKYKFTGKEKDSSSLYYFGARYYDPSIGRFTQIDPSFNPLESPYSYVENNPLNNVDPDGNEATAATDSTRGFLANTFKKHTTLAEWILTGLIVGMTGGKGGRLGQIEGRGLIGRNKGLNNLFFGSGRSLKNSGIEVKIPTKYKRINDGGKSVIDTYRVDDLSNGFWIRETMNSNGEVNFLMASGRNRYGTEYPLKLTTFSHLDLTGRNRKSLDQWMGGTLRFSESKDGHFKLMEMTFGVTNLELESTGGLRNIDSVELSLIETLKILEAGKLNMNYDQLTILYAGYSVDKQNGFTNLITRTLRFNDRGPYIMRENVERITTPPSEN